LSSIKAPYDIYIFNECKSGSLSKKFKDIEIVFSGLIHCIMFLFLATFLHPKLGITSESMLNLFLLKKIYHLIVFYNLLTSLFKNCNIFILD